MNEQDLRDCFAMFALAGLLMRGNNKLDQLAEAAYMFADDMLEARAAKDSVGLPPVRARKAKAK